MHSALRVNRYISSKYPNPVCDICISAELNFRSVTQANATTAALGTTSDFVRGIAECCVCKQTRTATRATPQRASADKELAGPDLENAI